MLDLIVLHGEFSLFTITVRGNFWYQIYQNQRQKILCQLMALIKQTKSSFDHCLLGRAQPVISPNLYSLMNIIAYYYCVGLHLHIEHGLSQKENFNNSVSVCILENSSPSSLDVNEHRYIHAFKSLRPSGMNSTNPFKIHLLHN